MSVCALVGAAEFNSVHFLSQHFDEVIAVDGGYESLRKISITPDHVVGDFDSLGYMPDHGSVCVHPSEKDESDMELAIGLARAHNHNTLVIYGALANRLDHTLANMQLLVHCARQSIDAYGVGSDFVVSALSGQRHSALSFKGFDPSILDCGSYGRFISVFSFGGNASGVSESGLKYGLNHDCLADDASLGLSNEFTGSSAFVSVEKGDLIIVFPIGAWDYLG